MYLYCFRCTNVLTDKSARTKSAQYIVTKVLFFGAAVKIIYLTKKLHVGTLINKKGGGAVAVDRDCGIR